MKRRVAFVKLQSCLDISQRRDERQDYNPDKGMERRIHQADRREENAQSAVSCIERGSERSGENQKERLQYLAAGTAGTANSTGKKRKFLLYSPRYHIDTHIPFRNWTDYSILSRMESAFTCFIKVMLYTSPNCAGYVSIMLPSYAISITSPA